MLGININYDKRIYGYDLLRAYAIFRVANGHGGHLLNGTILENFPWFVSPSGVDIFFVLSGFLIAYSFISNISKSNGNKRLSLAVNFWKRSSLRILPNYYIILLINYFLTKTNVDTAHVFEEFPVILFATFTQNLFYPFYDFFWESWSISVQEWFYLSFPLLLMGFAKCCSLKKSIVYISFIFIAVSVLYRLSIDSQHYDYFFWDINFKKVVLSRIDSIAFGMMAAWVRFYYEDIWKKYAAYSFVLGIALFISILYIPFELNTLYSNVIFLSITPIAIALGFPLIDKLKNVRSIVGRFISHISILSYAIYLVNLLTNHLLNHHFNSIYTNNGIINYFIYWAVTLTASYLLYIIIEQPIVTYGNQFLHTRKMMSKRAKYKKMKSA